MGAIEIGLGPLGFLNRSQMSHHSLLPDQFEKDLLCLLLGQLEKARLLLVLLLW